MKRKKYLCVKYLFVCFFLLFFIIHVKCNNDNINNNINIDYNENRKCDDNMNECFLYKDEEENNFLSLSNIVVSTSYYSDDKKEEIILLNHNVKENDYDYIIIDEVVSSYEMINIKCSFKIKKSFNKNKLTILLVKEIMDKRNRKRDIKMKKDMINDLDTNIIIKDLKKEETFLFTNIIDDNNNMVYSNLSLMLINLIPYSSYYKMDILIGDENYSMKLCFLKMNFFFHNSLSIVKYPEKKIDNLIMRSIIMKSIDKIRKLNIKCNKYNNIVNHYVVYNYRDYYSLPLIYEEKNYNIEKNENNKNKIGNTFVIIFIICLLFLLFVMYIYIIFIYLQYNIKNIYTQYIYYLFFISLMSIIFLFILYDLYYNIIQICIIFICTCTFFLFIFYKTLKALREHRKSS
ncbi:conserved Plasmodium membrane protein, unknown function [Plasmodium sp. gorilla clade G2]|uniref:conserved Plasmodium membrane protein, unknown function n=1 Tax=Plasmodium sp. gorilla clade G2 TaxID=880535 RepID=UPI000D2110D6|nr:conserved Plasmodium membrane protein, unknown function [Plasmodium sp. gorilla clade G2]SOV11891.1 conserved Plasmodium membrane protein, unknown function [Plasmodium sp. gorilla clade G2]